MSGERWIVVRNWERFQHPDAARSSVPPWIKLHTQLLSDEAYLELTPTRRAMLIGIWQEYARTRRALPEDTASLSRRLAQRVLSSDLEALSHAGFIEFSASKPASRVASLEKRREEVPPYPRQAGDVENEDEVLECERCGKPVHARSSCRFCGATPRQAGTSARALAKPSTYERALAFTQNVGVGYERPVFLDELTQRFGDLSDEQRDELAELHASANGAMSNPFLDE